MKTNLLAMLLVAVVASSVIADINDLKITELWVGRSGPDGTRDWLEVTNTGDTPVNLAPGPGSDGIAYDDESADISVAFVFPNETLMPGESLCLLIDVDADNPTDFPNAGAEFLAIWVPYDAILLGAQADGGLSQNGDGATLLNATTGAVVDAFTYTSADTDSATTMERIGEGPTDIRLSVLGESGAFEAQEFVDEFGELVVDDNGDPVILVGSPGIFKGFNKGGDDLIGDVNCDGVIDLLDVAPFVDVITSGEFNNKADINQDGSVDLLDVAPFIDLLTA